MRLFFTSSLGWLGCSAAAAAAALSLSTTNEGDGIPDDVGRSSEKLPVAFTQDGDSASTAGGARGSAGYAHYAQPWAGGPGRNSSSALRDSTLGVKQSDPAPAGVSGADDHWYGFGGAQFGSDPVTLPEAASPAQGQPLSLALKPEPYDSQFFLVNSGGFDFPGFPTGVPTGTGGATGTGSSGGSASFFLVENGGSPSTSNDGGPYNWGWSFGGTDAVPEPSSWALGCVALGLAIYLRRRSLIR